MGNLRAHRFKQSGFTLVEVMVTLGVASVLMLAVMEIVNFTGKANRNIKTGAEWNNLVASVRLALSNDKSCDQMFASSVWSGYAFDGEKLLPGPLARIAMKNPVTGGQVVIADSGPDAYPEFKLDPLEVRRVKDSPVNEIMVTDQTDGVAKIYNTYLAEITLKATKKGAPGAASVGSQFLGTTETIKFTVVTGPDHLMGAAAGTLASKSAIHGCFGQPDSLAALCTSIGGTYKMPPDYPDQSPCVVRAAQFFGGRQDPSVMLGAAGAAGSMDGERIQLLGEYGKKGPSDYAIGLQANSMWFNIGGDGENHFQNPNPSTGVVNSFLFHARSDDGSIDHDLMSIDAGGNLLLNPSNDFAHARLVFGQNLDASKPPSEFIQSKRGLFREPSNDSGEGLQFFTKSEPRLLLTHGGETHLGATDSGEAVLAFGGASDKTANKDRDARIFANLNSDQATFGSLYIQPRAETAGQDPKAKIQMAQWGAINVSAADTVSIFHNSSSGNALEVSGGPTVLKKGPGEPGTGDLSVEGNLTVAGKPVLAGCGVYRAGSGNEVKCPLDRPFAIAGGGHCGRCSNVLGIQVACGSFSKTAPLSASYPTFSGKDGDPATGWHSHCDYDGDSHQMGTYAICCAGPKTN